MQQVTMSGLDVKRLVATCLFVAGLIGGTLGIAQDEPTTHQRSYENGDRYTGTMHDGMRHGRGRYEWAHGHVYEGDYENDLPHGRGLYTWPTGAQYMGDFQQGLRHGNGRFTWGPGNYYEGEYRTGQRTGVGLRVREGEAVYEGGFVDGTRHGEGAQLEDSGDVFLGWYEHGLRSGLGVRRKPGGSLWLEAWQDGALIKASPIKPNPRCELIVDGMEWMFQGDECIDGKAHGAGAAVSLTGDRLAEEAGAVLGRLLSGKLRELHQPSWDTRDALSESSTPITSLDGE